MSLRVGYRCSRKMSRAGPFEAEEQVACHTAVNHLVERYHYDRPHVGLEMEMAAAKGYWAVQKGGHHARLPYLLQLHTRDVERSDRATRRPTRHGERDHSIGRRHPARLLVRLWQVRWLHALGSARQREDGVGCPCPFLAWSNQITGDSC